ncbi:MAG TPA: hypothetical protein VGV86_02015 [Acidimicrobiales bacterium]|nr:hypothetical protein [Acidimicrobiales bacterium]
MRRQSSSRSTPPPPAIAPTPHPAHWEPAPASPSPRGPRAVATTSTSAAPSINQRTEDADEGEELAIATHGAETFEELPWLLRLGARSPRTVARNASQRAEGDGEQPSQDSKHGGR